MLCDRPVYMYPDIPLDIVDNFGDIISSLNLFSLLFCTYLLIKGQATKVEPNLTIQETKLICEYMMNISINFGFCISDIFPISAHIFLQFFFLKTFFCFSNFPTFF